MLSVALGWQVYQMTGRPLDLGLVGLVQFLPYILFSLAGGHAADRFDRRKIVLISYVSLFICSVLFFGFAHTGQLTVNRIFVILFFVGLTRAFWDPANSALLPHLVTIQNLPRAAAMASTSWQLASILGPAAGGAIYAISGKSSHVYGVCSLFLLAAGICLLRVQVQSGRSDKEPTSLRSVLAGVRYIWSNKFILGSISLDLFAVLLAGAVALLPIYASDILKVGPSGLGLLRCAPGAGAACMGLFLAYRPLQRKIGAKFFASVAAFSVLTIAFGFSKNFYWSWVFLFLMGAFDFVSIVVRQLLIQVTTPSAVRGRVLAANFIFIGASNEFGEFESGLTAAWLGVVPAVVAGGIAACAITAIWALFFTRLRALDVIAAPISDQLVDPAAKDRLNQSLSKEKIDGR